MKDMKMIEDMVAKMMMGSHMGKKGMKPMGEMEDYGEEGYGMEGEDEGESEDETEVMIKFCGKDALKKAHELLMGSGKPYGK